MAADDWEPTRLQNIYIHHDDVDWEVHAMSIQAEWF